jgi:hypothetical protein
MKRSKLILKLLWIAQIITAAVLTAMMIKAMKLLYFFLGRESFF